MPLPRRTTLPAAAVLAVALLPAAAPAKLAPELGLRITEVLRSALDSRDALAQGRALLALTEQGDKTVARRAQEALAEENWGILQYALRIAAAGKTPDKGFMPAMLRALEDTRTRPRALELCEELPPAVRASVLKAALEREDSLRDEVLARMVDRSDPEALAVIAAGVRSKKAPVRKAALATLARIRGKAATAFLMDLVTGKDKTLRADEAVKGAAYAALLDSRDEAVVPFQVEQLAKAKDAGVKLRTAAALAGRADRNLVLPVLKAYIDSEDVELRVAALEGIAKIGDRVVAMSQRKPATNPAEDPRVAVAALELLGGSGDIANLPYLQEALATDHLHLRVGAVLAMGKLKRREAIPDLARALMDGNAQVRAAAARALGVIGGAEVVPFLERAVVPETDREVRARIIEALGRSGDPSGLQALQVLFAYKDQPDLVGGAVDAMLEIGDPSAVGVLLLAVDPAMPAVMEKAVKAICLLDETQGNMALDAYLQRFTLDFMHALNAEAGPRAVAFLERFLARGTPPQRALALELLLNRGEKGVEVVRQAARANSDPGIRRTALQSLASRSDRASMDLFSAGLADSDAGIKGLALEAVSRLYEGELSADLQGKLEKLMEDSSPSVRVAAAHTLYKLAQ